MERRKFTRAFKLEAVRLIKERGVAKLRFPTGKPCLSGPLPVESLGLAVDDFALTFEQNLRQIGGCAVFASPSKLSIPPVPTFSNLIPNVVLRLRKWAEMVARERE